MNLLWVGFRLLARAWEYGSWVCDFKLVELRAEGLGPLTEPSLSLGSALGCRGLDEKRFGPKTLCCCHMMKAFCIQERILQDVTRDICAESAAL